MIRKPRPYWGSSNYRKPKRTTKTFTRSRQNYSNPKRDRYETDVFEGHRKRSAPHNKIPDDGRERVKRCVNCEHFSSDLNTCNQCGVALREDARLFLNPAEVRSVFRDILGSVANMGPDFLPMKINLESCNQPNLFSKSQMQSSGTSNSEESNASAAGTDNMGIKVEAEIAEDVITIESDDEQELKETFKSRTSENTKYGKFGKMEMGISDAGTSPHISDEDATDLVHQMQTADCPPTTNYFVKKCCRCQTYSFDLQKCETCKKKISPRAEIILYQSISKRKLKSDEWRKAKYHVIQQEKLKVPIPMELCNMNMVNKMIARGGSKNPNKAGKPRKKSQKKKSKSKCQSEPLTAGTAEASSNDVKSPAKANGTMGSIKDRLKKRKRASGAKVTTAKKSKINSQVKASKVKKDVNNN